MLKGGSTYESNSTTLIKAFPLALCGLSLWLLVSMMISKFDPHHGYLSSVSLQLQMVCPNTWILWLLWLSWLLWILWFIISFRMAHKEKWTKFFADLLVLGLAYIIFIFTVNSFTFIFISSQPWERNTSTILSLCMDHVHIANIFRFQLHHHTSLIKLTLLQLHHCKSLTIIMLVTHDPLTLITRALLTSTTRAHYIHETFSKLPLFHANIPFHSSVFVHLQI